MVRCADCGASWPGYGSPRSQWVGCVGNYVHRVGGVGQMELGGGGGSPLSPGVGPLAQPWAAPPKARGSLGLVTRCRRATHGTWCSPATARGTRPQGRAQEGEDTFAGLGKGGKCRHGPRMFRSRKHTSLYRYVYPSLALSLSSIDLWKGLFEHWRMNYSGPRCTSLWMGVSLLAL